MGMQRRDFLKGLAATAALPYAPFLEEVALPAPRSRDVFDRAIVIDALCVVGGERREFEEEDWQAFQRSGYSAIQTTLGSSSFDVAVRQLGDWARRFREHPDRLIRVTSTEDIRRAKAMGKLGVMLGFQNATMIEQDVGNLDTLYDLGTRCIQLTYNSRNLLGDGCTERTQCGLSDFAVQCLERMNDLGIIVDLSHCGVGTTADGIELSRVAPCFTHSMCQEVYSRTIRHPRAKADGEMRALADRGGVMGIATLGYFVGPSPGASFGDYMDHIDHAVNVMGIEHVGLCTDHQLRGIQPWATRENWYEPRLRSFKPEYNVRWPPWIHELDVPERFRNVAHGLSQRGYGDHDVELILGGNWLRYFRDVLGA